MPRKKLGPLALESIREIELIVNNIKKGHYKHDQRTFHNEVKDIGGPEKVRTLSKSGLLHNIPTTPRCGTAHCIAGWKIIRDIAKKAKVSIAVVADAPISQLQVLGKRYINAEYIDGCTDAEYSQAQWGLTPPEADMLFNGHQTLDGMLEAIAHFKLGHRYARMDTHIGYKVTWVDGITGKKIPEPK
jgi:hypothetical protein